MKPKSQKQKNKPMSDERFLELAAPKNGLLELSKMCEVLTPKQLKEVKKECLNKICIGLGRTGQETIYLAWEQRIEHIWAKEGLSRLAARGLLDAEDRESLWQKGVSPGGQIDGWLLKIYSRIYKEGPGEVSRLMQGPIDEGEMIGAKYTVGRELLQRKKLAQEWDPDILLNWFLTPIPEIILDNSRGDTTPSQILKAIPDPTWARLNKESLVTLVSSADKEIRVAVLGRMAKNRALGI